jgi:hypothetical protein
MLTVNRIIMPARPENKTAGATIPRKLEIKNTGNPNVFHLQK